MLREAYQTLPGEAPSSVASFKTLITEDTEVRRERRYVHEIVVRADNSKMICQFRELVHN